MGDRSISTPREFAQPPLPYQPRPPITYHLSVSPVSVPTVSPPPHLPPITYYSKFRIQGSELLCPPTPPSSSPSPPTPPFPPLQLFAHLHQPLDLGFHVTWQLHLVSDTHACFGYPPWPCTSNSRCSSRRG